MLGESVDIIVPGKGIAEEAVDQDDWFTCASRDVMLGMAIEVDELPYGKLLGPFIERLTILRHERSHLQTPFDRARHAPPNI